MAMILPMAAQSTSSHGVKGYIKKDGTYVAPHRQTNSNSTQKDILTKLVTKELGW